MLRALLREKESREVVVLSNWYVAAAHHDRASSLVNGLRMLPGLESSLFRSVDGKAPCMGLEVYDGFLAAFQFMG